jgi:hypothetical protein
MSEDDLESVSRREDITPDFRAAEQAVVRFLEHLGAELIKLFRDQPIP